MELDCDPPCEGAVKTEDAPMSDAGMAQYTIGVGVVVSLVLAALITILCCLWYKKLRPRSKKEKVQKEFEKVTSRDKTKPKASQHKSKSMASMTLLARDLPPPPPSQVDVAAHATTTTEEIDKGNARDPVSRSGKRTNRRVLSSASGISVDRLSNKKKRDSTNQRESGRASSTQYKRIGSGLDKTPKSIDVAKLSSSVHPRPITVVHDGPIVDEMSPIPVENVRVPRDNTVVSTPDMFVIPSPPHPLTVPTKCINTVPPPSPPPPPSLPPQQQRLSAPRISSTTIGLRSSRPPTSDAKVSHDLSDYRRFSSDIKASLHTTPEKYLIKTPIEKGIPMGRRVTSTKSEIMAQIRAATQEDGILKHVPEGDIRQSDYKPVVGRVVPSDELIKDVAKGWANGSQVPLKRIPPSIQPISTPPICPPPPRSPQAHEWNLTQQNGQPFCKRPRSGPVHDTSFKQTRSSPINKIHHPRTTIPPNQLSYNIHNRMHRDTVRPNFLPPDTPHLREMSAIFDEIRSLRKYTDNEMRLPHITTSLTQQPVFTPNVSKLAQRFEATNRRGFIPTPTAINNRINEQKKPVSPVLFSPHIPNRTVDFLSGEPQWPQAQLTCYQPPQSWNPYISPQNPASISNTNPQSIIAMAHGDTRFQALPYSNNCGCILQQPAMCPHYPDTLPSSFLHPQVHPTPTLPSFTNSPISHAPQLSTSAPGDNSIINPVTQTKSSASPINQLHSPISRPIPTDIRVVPPTDLRTSSLNVQTPSANVPINIYSQITNVNSLPPQETHTEVCPWARNNKSPITQVFTSPIMQSSPLPTPTGNSLAITLSIQSPTLPYPQVIQSPTLIPPPPQFSSQLSSPYFPTQPIPPIVQYHNVYQIPAAPTYIVPTQQQNPLIDTSPLIRPSMILRTSLDNQSNALFPFSQPSPNLSNTPLQPFQPMYNSIPPSTVVHQPIPANYPYPGNFPVISQGAMLPYQVGENPQYHIQGVNTDFNPSKLQQALSTYPGTVNINSTVSQFVYPGQSPDRLIASTQRPLNPPNIRTRNPTGDTVRRGLPPTRTRGRVPSPGRAMSSGVVREVVGEDGTGRSLNITKDIKQGQYKLKSTQDVPPAVRADISGYTTKESQMHDKNLSKMPPSLHAESNQMQVQSPKIPVDSQPLNVARNEQKAAASGLGKVSQSHPENISPKTKETAQHSKKSAIPISNIPSESQPPVQNPVYRPPAPRLPASAIQGPRSATPRTPQTAVTPRTPQTAVIPRTPQTAVTPRTPQTAVTPRTPQTAVTPRTPQTAVTPRTPQTAVTPRTPQTAVTPRTPGPSAQRPKNTKSPTRKKATTSPLKPTKPKLPSPKKSAATQKASLKNPASPKGKK